MLQAALILILVSYSFTVVVVRDKINGQFVRKKLHEFDKSHRIYEYGKLIKYYSIKCLHTIQLRHVTATLHHIEEDSQGFAPRIWNSDQPRHICSTSPK